MKTSRRRKESCCLTPTQEKCCFWREYVEMPISDQVQPHFYILQRTLHKFTSKTGSLLQSTLLIQDDHIVCNAVKDAINLCFLLSNEVFFFFFFCLPVLVQVRIFHNPNRKRNHTCSLHAFTHILGVTHIIS